MIDFSCIKNAFDNKEYIPFKCTSDDVLRELTEYAFKNVNLYFQKEHIEQLMNVSHSPDERDRLVASIMKENAYCALKEHLPLCQDTGVASIYAFVGTESPFFKELNSFTSLIDEGVKNAYIKNNLRFSINKPSSMLEEKDTRNNTPSDINVFLQDSDKKNTYIIYSAKGGGSSNKTCFEVKTKSFLNENSIQNYISERVNSIGTSACPPYKVSFVIGGLSPEDNLTYAKMATITDIQNSDNALRCHELERYVLECANGKKRGQFNSATLVSSASVIRLPRHGASLFVSFALSCSASRNMFVKITCDEILTEKLCTSGLRNDSENIDKTLSALPHFEVSPFLNGELNKLPKNTLFTLSGPITVARDKVHFALMNENRVPEYMKDYPIFYAGPTETPIGKKTGSIGPTTSSRMDEGAIFLMERGASKVMIGKGERSEKFYDECKKNMAIYVKALGGVAAFTALNSIIDSKVVDYSEFGMESVRIINVKNMLLST